MPEFLRLLSPTDALGIFLQAIPDSPPDVEIIEATSSLGRVLAETIFADHPMPAFTRSAMDGFAVRAADTYGASDSLPAYLEVVGEVLMGTQPSINIGNRQAIIIHTGGMLPEGADAVVALEYTQQSNDTGIEILRPVATGENVLRIGEDVQAGADVIPIGSRIREVEIGGMMALGNIKVRVARKPRVGIISTGNEVVAPEANPLLGQVRDINSYSLGAIVYKAGGDPVLYGIVPDDFDRLATIAKKTHEECDLVIITAGSSASARDMTAEVIKTLGSPGVLVHGVNIKPGKPTILGVCENKPVIGLPGNPVSAFVIARRFLLPVIDRFLGIKTSRLEASIPAKLTTNIPSQAGREDWVPVKLHQTPIGELAEPIFSKSNLIFSLVSADGLVRIPPDATGLSRDESIHVYPL